MGKTIEIEVPELGIVGDIWWNLPNFSLHLPGAWLLNFHTKDNQLIHNVALSKDKDTRPKIIAKRDNFLIITV